MLKKKKKKESLVVSNTISQAIPVDGHVCVFWTISYAITVIIQTKSMQIDVL